MPHLDVPPWAWIAFNAYVVGLLLLDLYGFNKKAHEIHWREAAWLSAFFVGASLAVNAVVWVAYGHAAGRHASDRHAAGRQAAQHCAQRVVGRARSAPHRHVVPGRRRKAEGGRGDSSIWFKIYQNCNYLCVYCIVPCPK